MLHATIQVILYGLVAGLSAVGLGAMLAVIPSGRLKAVGFGGAFVGAQLLTCSVLVIFGIAATGFSDKSFPGFRAALEIVLALVLIALAVVVHRRPPNTRESPTGERARKQALLERLGQLRFLTTVVAGFLLGIGGPKRLVLTCLASATIVTAGVGDVEQPPLVVVYVTLATALVWGPLVLFVFLGQRAMALMEGAEREVGRRQPQITVYTLLVLAALFISHAVAVLLT